MKQGIPSGWTGGKCPKFVLVFGIFFILFVLADQARVGRYRRRGKSVRITSERVINGKSRLSEWLTKHNEYLLPPSFIRQTLCRANIFHPIWCWFTEFGNRNWFWKSDLEDAPLFLTVGESSTKLWTSSSFPLTTEDSVNTESPTLCTIERAGSYAKRKVRSAFFPASHKTARLLQPHALLKTSTLLGEQLPMNPLPYSSSWLRMLLAVPFIFNSSPKSMDHWVQ